MTCSRTRMAVLWASAMVASRSADSVPGTAGVGGGATRDGGCLTGVEKMGSSAGVGLAGARAKVDEEGRGVEGAKVEDGGTGVAGARERSGCVQGDK